MAKRFTDTDKWKKPFIKSLDAPYKLLWFYILDDCDHAGIWQADFDVASLRIGFPVDEKTAVEKFGERMQKISAGKFFLPDFIFFQYGVLNDKNRLHVSVINILNKNGIKPLRSPLEGVKDKDKDKEQDKDKDKDKDKNKERGVQGGDEIIPEMLSIWCATNPHYTKNQDSDYPALLKILQFMSNDSGITNFFEVGNRNKLLNTFQTVADYVHGEDFWRDKPLSTISNQIQGFYNKLKSGKNGKSVNKTLGQSTHDVFAKQYNKQ